MSFGRAELFGGFVEFRKRSACVLPIEIYDARFLRLAQTCCIEAGVRLDAKTLRGEELAGHFSHEQLLGIALASNDKRLREGGDGRLNGENCDKGAREDGAPGPSAPHPHGRVRSRRAWGLTEVPPPYNRAHAGEHSGGRELALADAAQNVGDHHARIGRARSGSDTRLYKVQRHAILQSKEECTNREIIKC